ncbi:MAG: hypothetical protein Q7N50_04330 [Armatimonadota bacterium]|nr:hypothetical protein [Armatimonadota bacterium]
MDKIENYLDSVRKSLDVRTDAERDAIIAEIKDHVMEITARLEKEGFSHEVAVNLAVSQMGDQRVVAAAVSRSPFLFIPKFIGYILCFILPAVGLSLLFPNYFPHIVLTAGVLLFLVSGFIMGIWWSDPAWTKDTRGQTQHLIFLIFFMMPIIAGIGEAIKQHQLQRLISALVISSAMLVLSLGGFYLGRAVDRRRAKATKTV